jgi:prevent-host-death family protein
MTEISSLAETKAHLSQLVARVGEQHERILVTVHGRPAAVILSVDDLESMEATIEALSDTAALRAMSEADAELARGDGEDEDSLAAAMRAHRAGK